MPQTPAEYIESLNRLMRLLNKIVIKQSAMETILKDHLGITAERWDEALAKATQSVGWAVMPERGTETLTDALEHLLKK